MAVTFSRKESMTEAVELHELAVETSFSPFLKRSTSSLRSKSSLIHRRPRANTLEDVNAQQDISILRNRLHRGSVRGTFSTENRLSRRIWRVINSIGRSRKDYSLFLFHKNTKFRKNVKKIAKSKVFQVLMGLLVLLHSAVLCIYRPDINGDQVVRNRAIYYVTVVVILLYMVEAGLNIIAYGLIQSKKAYLRNAAHVLDIVVIILGILYLSIAMGQHPLIGEIFACFMAIKLIKLFTLSQSVRFILKALAKSFAPLFYLFILTFIVITFLALIGIQLFNGSLHGGCFASYVTPAGRNKTILVSDFPCDKTANGSNGSMPLPGSHTCPFSSTCSNWDEGPRRGIISFDNMGTAYLTVFQVISLEGWITILYLYESALGYQWVWLYFNVVMFFGSIFILNLWTGVLTSVFVGVSDREEDYGKSRQLKEKQRITEDLQNYNDWLKISAEIDAPSDTGSYIDRRHSLFMWTDPLDEDSDEGHGSEEEPEREEIGGAVGTRRRARVWLHKSRKAVRKVVKHKFFLWSMLTLRAINLILLMSLHFPPEFPVFDTVIFSLNYVFSVVYVVEFLLGLFSLSRRRYLTYFKNPLHISETVLAGLSVLELVVFIPVDSLRERHMSVILNAVWCLKLIMFVKHTRSWKGMKEILRTVFQLLPAVLSLMALVVTFLFVYTILGLRLFGSRLSNTGFVEPNFDDLYTSFLLVFQLMTSEDWNNLLFTSLDYWIDDRGMAVGGTFAIYFVLGVGFGSFILLVVFLAMSVDKLSEVRGLQSDSAQQQEKTEKKRNERKQYLSELKKEPQVKRRTLRRALKYISDKDVPATTPMHTKKSRELTLRLRSGSSRDSRSVSSPLSGTSQGERKEDVDSPPAKETVKLRNPLRLVKQRSEFFEQQKLRTLESTVDKQTSLERSAKTRRLSTKMSLDSATSRRESESSGPVPYTRTQSSPADSPLITESVTTFSELPTLDPIEEMHRSGSQELGSERDQADTDPESTQRYPLSLSAVDEHLTRALRRGGSLEDFNTISADPKSALPKSETAKKIKEKVQRLLKWVRDYVGTIQLDPEKELAEIPDHSSFFILAPDNRFRQFCYKVVCSKAFSTITYVVVFVSSFLLTLEIPIGVDASTADSDSFVFFLCNVQQVVIWFDCILMGYFVVEMLLKMISLGMLLHKGSYLRGFFNIMDCFVLIANLLPIIAYLAIIQSQQLDSRVCIAYSYHPRLPQFIGVLRVFRVLRPLRAVRIGGLYLVVSGLMSSIKSMGSIFFMTMLVLIVFSVAGVHFFKGQFYYCNDPMMTQEESCSGQYFVYDYTFTGAAQFPGLSCPQAEDRQWLRRGLNFDNIGHATLALFSMLTIEGWQNVMYSGINSVAPVNNTAQGQVPGSHNSAFAAVYFILYMIVMALILVQLFTGFVIVTFQDVGVKSFRETKLNRNQRNCLYYALTMKPLRQYVPRFDLHRRFHNAMLPIVEHAATQWIIAIALIVNCILLACVMYGNNGLNLAVYYINIGFTVFFALEAIMKIIVLTPPTYFRDVSHVFDFLIAVASFLEIVIQNSVELIPQQYRYSHIASSFRVLRLLTFISNIRLILWTVIKSLEIFPWVGFLLMIVFFMYTVVGMQVFGNIRRAPIDELSADREITEYNNFANFPQALLVMIRMATGENWQDIMLSCVPPQDCERMNTTGTCGSDFAYFFFPSFYFISSIMILNLLVAIVIDNFDYILRDRSELSAHQLSVFVKLWSHYDKEAKGSLPTRSVLDLMRQCNPPVGWGRLCPELQAYKKMVKMNMPVTNGEVTFNATLFALVRTALNIECSGCPECAKSCNVRLKQKLRILFPTMDIKKIDKVLPMENDPTVGEEYAALLVQRIWRGYTLKRRRVLELFHGTGTKKVLKAGLRTVPDPGPALLHRDSSDFELDLPSAPPRKTSETGSLSTVGTGPRSPDIFTFAVDIEPTRRYSTGLEVAPWMHSGDIYPAAVSSPTQAAAASNTPPTSAGRPRPLPNNQPQSTRQPSLGAEPPASAQDRRHSSKGFVLREDPSTRDSVADNVSELSFTSAYSNPQDWERMETTV